MAAPPKPTTVVEFVCFRVKPSVKPEEGDKNREGEQLLDLFRETILQHGHIGSSWGRTLEDENVIVWVIEWADATNAASLSRLAPFIDPSNNKGDDDVDPLTLTTFFSTLSPSISETDTFTTNPVTEIAAFAIPSDIPTDQHKQLNVYQADFRNAGLTKMVPESTRPVSWARGQVERPSTFVHPDTPSGKALVYLNILGWKSREQHAAARETQAFADTITPIRKMVLAPVKGMEMKHVKFQKIGF